MDNDSETTLPTPAVRDDTATPATPPPRRRRGSWLPLLVILVLAAGVAAWAWLQETHRERERTDATAREDRVTAAIAEATREDGAMRREVEALRNRLSDAEAMNRSLREELLGVTERSRALEDAVANLAQQRLTSRDVLALNEAEYVLQLAGERLTLFHDPAAAIAAYRLADSALASAEDPLFASVRQTIAAEIQALEAAQPLQTQATLGALAMLREAATQWPARPLAVGEDALQPTSRVGRLIAPFVRIRRDDEGAAIAPRETGLARTLVVLDLRAAEAALFARDQAAFTGALERARGGLDEAFDPATDGVREARASLDRLLASPLAPALPELGTALRELRNLRSARALSREPVAHASP